MIVLKPENVNFSSASVVDPIGKVFFYKYRVFRAIYTNESAIFCKSLLESTWIKDAFEAGLVSTWIPTDISLEGTSLVLEHQLIPFEIHPAECSSYMHWLSAKAMIQLNIILCRHGFILKDSHPWNLMFYKGFPVFIDFGSLQKESQISEEWFSEFKRYFAAPIWLAAKGKIGLSWEYRRQHLTGFGLRLHNSTFVQKTIFRSLNRLVKFFAHPLKFFAALDSWLDSFQPYSPAKEYWASYEQSGDIVNPLQPTTPKHQFVYEILNSVRPQKVLDCAANKGLYSELAARMGASVIAFDYEEFCVDNCLKLAQSKQLNITPALMNFIHPTPPSGLGLLGDDSYLRFQSEIVLALGLVHHICITQRIPVNVFCEICMRYADRGIILEFVDPTDKHVESWNMPIPLDYSLDNITDIFSKKFSKYKSSDKITIGGINRIMIYYFK